MSKIKENKGVTLIALSVTVIVMIILTSIGINMFIGDNGIITEANSAKVKTIHSNVYNKMKLESLNHSQDRRRNVTDLSLVEHLQEKGILSEAIEEGKWQINVQTLLGEKQDIGNGNASEGKDIYTLEDLGLDVTTNRIKYSVAYYGKTSEENASLGEIVDKEAAATGNSGGSGGGPGGNTVTAGQTATNGNKEYSDGTETAIIPKGFTVSGISTEQTIAKGL